VRGPGSAFDEALYRVPLAKPLFQQTLLGPIPASRTTRSMGLITEILHLIKAKLCDALLSAASLQYSMHCPTAQCSHCLSSDMHFFHCLVACNTTRRHW
jgi:hypothetical protein